ncbi:hypothetical protein BHE74_00040809 [Ensete ventricosum]|nr:hypothetical protein BHE74_00040809 [Ensete ventricosum]
MKRRCVDRGEGTIDGVAEVAIMSDGGTIGKQGMVGGEDKKVGVLTLKVNSGEEATLDLTGKKDWTVGEIAAEGVQWQ